MLKMREQEQGPDSPRLTAEIFPPFLLLIKIKKPFWVRDCLEKGKGEKGLCLVWLFDDKLHGKIGPE